MVENSIVESVRAFAELVRSRLPVKRVVLFGSCARGTQREDSDIDVAVILKKTPVNVWKTEAELYTLARKIDIRIEPVLTREEHDAGGFWEEISRYGHTVYASV